MTEKFKKAFKLTIGHEGGYVNDPDDPGGETKFGISKRSYPKIDIKNITLADAQSIYHRDFWTKLFCEDLEEDIAIELFDTSVNVGIRKGSEIFQQALNLCNKNQIDYDNITVDGSIGTITLNAYNACKLKKLLLKVMNILQGYHYISLMEKKEVFEKYIGWFDRVQISHNR